MTPKLHVARAELVLARPAHEPLAELALDPDPLQAFAAAYQCLDDTLQETAEVVVDVLPLSAWETRRARARLRRRARRDSRHHPAAPPRARSRQRDPLGLGDLLARPTDSRSRADAVESAERHALAQALRAKTVGHAPLLQTQVLLCVQSEDRGRARAHLRAILAAFDQFAARNHWRAVGHDLLGVWLLGSDGMLCRRRFDRRRASGRFAAPRRNLVTPVEVAGLLKPPTARCHAPNVIRSGGVIVPAPAELPTFTGQPQLLPLGRVRDRRGDRTVGVALKDTFFSYMAGRSRYGKTELGLVQFIHLARAGHGGLFLDPHADAIQVIKTYLTDSGVRDRVIEVNLSAPPPASRSPGGTHWPCTATHPTRRRPRSRPWSTPSRRPCSGTSATPARSR